MGMAGAAAVSSNWEPVARRIREEATDDWDNRVAVERFEGKGGTFVRGAGRLVGPSTVAVDDRTFTAGRAIVVATGTEPAVPPISGLQFGSLLAAIGVGAALGPLLLRRFIQASVVLPMQPGTVPAAAGPHYRPGRCRANENDR